MSKDRFGYDQEEVDSTMISRWLNSTIPALGISAGQVALALGIQGDTKGSKNQALLKELKKIAPKGVKISTLNTSKNPIAPLINPLAGSHYNPRTNSVVMAQRGNNPNAGVLAHELGHAQQFKNPSSLLNKGAKYSRLANMFGLTTAPLWIAEDESTAKKWAGIGTALSAPNFIHEMDASWKGRKMLLEAASKSGNKLGLLKSLASFKGVPSYLMALAAPMMIYKYLKSKGQYNER